jgi:uncharacterized protein (DUF1330 family)
MASTRVSFCDHGLIVAYVISEVEVLDEQQGLRYRDLAAASIARHGGRYLVRGVKPDAPEGDWPTGLLLVVVEFPSMERLQSWHASSDYAEALAVLRRSLDGSSLSKGSTSRLPCDRPAGAIRSACGRGRCGRCSTGQAFLDSQRSRSGRMQRIRASSKCAISQERQPTIPPRRAPTSLRSLHI